MREVIDILDVFQGFSVVALPWLIGSVAALVAFFALYKLHLRTRPQMYRVVFYDHGIPMLATHRVFITWEAAKGYADTIYASRYPEVLEMLTGVGQEQEVHPLSDLYTHKFREAK